MWDVRDEKEGRRCFDADLQCVERVGSGLFRTWSEREPYGCENVWLSGAHWY